MLKYADFHGRGAPLSFTQVFNTTSAISYTFCVCRSSNMFFLFVVKLTSSGTARRTLAVETVLNLTLFLVAGTYGIFSEEDSL